MRDRRIAVLIDGGYFQRRLPHLVDDRFCSTPRQVADSARHLCKRHVQRLTGSETNQDGRWLDHVYRLFYYDAEPYQGKAHHPITNQPLDFSKTQAATFHNELFAELRRKRKFALRLGHVNKESDWQIHHRHTKKLLKTQKWIDRIEDTLLWGNTPPELSAEEAGELHSLARTWRNLGERPNDVNYSFRQKGVDMRIGLDISSITLKGQADTIVLVTGDSDFVPAAKLARREGIEFLLDPLWQSVSDDLYEHVDGIVWAFPNPNQNPINQDN